MDVKSASSAPTQPVHATKRNEASQQAQRRDAAPPKEHVAAKATEPKPRPLVNTQGHTTGRVLNATA